MANSLSSLVIRRRSGIDGYKPLPEAVKRTSAASLTAVLLTPPLTPQTLQPDLKSLPHVRNQRVSIGSMELVSCYIERAKIVFVKSSLHSNLKAKLDTINDGLFILDNQYFHIDILKTVIDMADKVLKNDLKGYSYEISEEVEQCFSKIEAQVKIFLDAFKSRDEGLESLLKEDRKGIESLWEGVMKELKRKKENPRQLNLAV